MNGASVLIPHARSARWAACCPRRASRRCCRSCANTGHACLWPSLQSACWQAVLQYHAVLQTLEEQGDGWLYLVLKHERQHVAQGAVQQLPVCTAHQTQVFPTAAADLALPAHLQHLLPVPSPASGPPANATLVQRR